MKKLLPFDGLAVEISFKQSCDAAYNSVRNFMVSIAILTTVYRYEILRAYTSLCQIHWTVAVKKLKNYWYNTNKVVKQANCETSKFHQYISHKTVITTHTGCPMLSK